MKFKVIVENKKGADKLISVYWFAILILVAGGIYLMVSAFHSAPYDVRSLEVRILSNKVADCFSDRGVIDEALIDSKGLFKTEFKNNFLSNCNIIIDSQDPDYYIQVDFYSPTNLQSSVFTISEGNKNWISSCNIQDKEEHETLPKCLERRFYSVDSGNNQHLIKILSVVGKVQENVK